jgi:DNA helicase-2/ATP-dependent DNA helicase PcrA
MQDIKEQVLAAAGKYGDIRSFLKHVEEVTTKNNDREKQDLKEEAINIMSIHSSKGLQYPVVLLVHCIENVLPHKHVMDLSSTFSVGYQNVNNFGGSIEEEKRLLYVAITRAMEELIISAPKRYNNTNSQLSRFIENSEK